MIGDWYFCCCIKASPAQAKSFLAILDTLDDSDADQRLLGTALDELLRLDVWMQLYALPHVLSARAGESFPSGLNSYIGVYLDALLEHLPDSLVDICRGVRNAIAEISAHRSFLATVERSAAELRVLPQRYVSPVPYMDLYTFAAECLTLSALVDRVAGDSQFAAQLLAALDGQHEPSPLEPLLDDCLEGRRGRLAFRLAIRLRALLNRRGGDDEEWLRLFDQPGAALPFEPDLLETFAEAAFASDHDMSPEDVVSKLVEESVRMSMHGLWGEFDRSNVKAALERIALIPHQQENALIKAVYWHVVLWTVAARVDADATIRALARLWLTPDGPSPAHVTVRAPYHGQGLESWKRRLVPLLQLRPPRTDVHVEEGSEVEIPKAAARLFWSPWMSLTSKKGALRKFNRDRPRYPRVEDTAALVRLCCAGDIAVGLLRRAEDAPPAQIAAFVAHASDVIRSFAWLRHHETRVTSEKHLDIPEPLIGLAAHARRQVELAGRGTFPSIPPEAFLDIARAAREAEPPRSRDRVKFEENILPWMMMRWISDAFIGARGTEGQTRWLAHIEEVYAYVAESRPAYPERIGAALMRRFLSESLDSETGLDWTLAKSKDRSGPAQWQVDSRQLLLSRPMTPDAWYRPEWYEGDIHPLTQMARAVERVSALGRGTIDPDVEQAWREDLSTRLDEISEPRFLDRFQRLRLVELLDEPALANHTDTQTQISLVILEFGGPFELAHLFRRLFGEEASSSARETVQGIFAETLVRAIEKLEADGPESRKVAADPRHIKNISDLKDMQLRLLQAIAYRAAQAGVGATERQLYGRLRGMWKAARHHRRTRRQPLTLELPLGKGRHHRVPMPEGRQGLQHWEIAAAVHDCNRSETLLFLDEYRQENQTNVFTLDASRYESFRRGDFDSHVHVVAIMVDTLVRPGGQRRYRFNCGLPYYIEARPLEFPLSAGDVVSMPLEWIDSGKKGRWYVDGERRIQRLRKYKGQGQVKRVEVFEEWRDGRRNMDVHEFRHKGRGDTVQPDRRDLWDPDAVRRFCGVGQGRAIVESIDMGQSLWPSDNTFLDFLLDRFARAGGRPTVLTVIETEPSGHGEQNVRFSARPGLNYVFCAADFRVADWERLTAEIEERPSALGLLVTLDAEEYVGGVRLYLSDTAPSDERSSIRYPELQCPFDDRNLRWRAIMHVGLPIEADRVGGAWFVDLEGKEPRGFPGRLKVDWHWHKSPEYTATTAEGIVLRWGAEEQRSAMVVAESVFTNKMNLPRGSELDLLSRWLNLREGDELTITRAISSLSGDGNVRCLTPIGVTVFVERESLSMMPVAPDEPLDLGGGRHAQVYRIERRPTKVAPDIHANELPERVQRNGEGIAVLTRVPRPRSTGALCEAAWVYDDGVEQKDIHLRNLQQLKVGRCGSVLKARAVSGAWHLELVSPRVLVRALWSVDEKSQSDDFLIYLGRVSWRGRLRSLAEAKGESRLVLLPEGTGPAAHLATIDGGGFGATTLPQPWITRNDAYDRSWWDDGIPVRRAHLPIEHGERARALTGLCMDDSPIERAAVVDVRLDLAAAVNKQFILRRLFRLEKVALRKLQNRKDRRKGRAVPKEKADAIWRRRWERFLEDPSKPVTGTLSDDSRLVLDDRLRVPVAGDWHSSVPLRSGDGPFVAFAPYDSNADALLVESPDGSEWRASVRDVPPRSVERFLRETNAHLGVEVKLELPFTYVGRRPKTADDDSSRQHLFEWAPGRTLLVTEEQLRYDGKPFATAKHFVLFHGDEITTVRFEEVPRSGTVDKDQVDDSGEEDPKKLVLSIEGIHIRFAAGTTLFRQRRRHRFVHVLKLRRRQGEIEIESVLGYDVGHVDAPMRPFQRLKAVLAPEDAERLEDRLEENAKTTVLGRLNDELFESTFGHRLEFQHVRMSLVPKKAGAPLEEGELFFVEAGRIVPFGANNTALSLRPLSKIPTADRDDALTERLRLLRRSFSEREDLLDRIAREEGPEALDGDILVVRLGHDYRRNAIVTFSEQIPSRLVRALASAVAAQDGPLLACVAQQTRGDESLRLELKPGSYVRLKPHHVTSKFRFKPGDVVIVRNDPDAPRDFPRFQLTRAAFSHGRYVPRETRPAVALPKDLLLRESVWQDHDVGDDRFWSHGENFTIGDLSNLKAGCGRYDEQHRKWSEPYAQDCIDLMSTPHPKVVALGRDRNERFWIGRPLRGVRWGWLRRDDGGSINAFITQNGKEAEYSVKWRDMTFGDEPARAVVERVKQEWWRYHDKSSGYWAGDRIASETLGEHHLGTGPLFFEIKDDDTLRLRFGPDLFLSRGLPVTALVASLRSRKGTRGDYPVAGWSNEGGLWLELVPGRIVEVPAQLLLHRTGGRRHSLADMDWHRFAPGDRVALSLARSDMLSLDSFALQRWRPGPRASFGPQCVWLPIVKHQPREGGLTLGAGKCQVTVPFVRAPEGWEERKSVGLLVGLDADNSLFPGAIGRPAIGDTVLLRLAEQGTLMVIGFDGLRPVADDNKEGWALDPLADELVDRRGSRVVVHRRHAARLVAAAGGALPVTVEGIHNDLLFFSRRHQRLGSKLRPGLMTQAHVLGFFDEPVDASGYRHPPHALLRAGSGLLRVRVDEIVSGLPIPFTDAAVDALRDGGIHVWLRGGAEESLEFGLAADPEGDFDVTPEVVLSREQEDKRFSGLICRSIQSEKLYWLPQVAVGWAHLEAEDLRRHFVEQRRRCKVIRKEITKRTPQVSITDTREAKNEFDELEIGRELTVEVLHERDVGQDSDHTPYLVRSLRSKILMELTHFDDTPLHTRKERRVEVVSRYAGRQRRCTVVLIGQRRYTLDLPVWMTTMSVVPGVRREAFNDYIAWRTEEPPSPPAPGSERDELDQDLVRRLCHAVTRTERHDYILWPDVEVARRWLCFAREETEMELHLALAAILVLESRSRVDVDRISAEMHDMSIGDTKDAYGWRRRWHYEARVALQNVGRRALRSLHVDVLATRWICRESDRGRTLHHRLELLRETLQPPVLLDDIRRVRRFCDAARLRGDMGLLPISQGLQAAIGELKDVESLVHEKCSERSVTEQLAALYRTLPESNVCIRLNPSHVKSLWRLLHQLEDYNWDITLLGPLPVFELSPVDSRKS